MQLGFALHERMPRACWAVFDAMARLGGWATLAEISERAHLSENTTSTRISENARCYGALYRKRKVGNHYEYRLLPGSSLGQESAA